MKPQSHDPCGLVNTTTVFGTIGLVKFKFADGAGSAHVRLNRILADG